MASPQLQILIQMVRAQPFREDAPVEETRAGFEQFGQMFVIPPDIKREAANADGVPGEWFSAPNSTDAITFFYLHGGGYAIGSTNTHADLTARLARACAARVFSLNYRLAPENPYPAAVEDASKAYRWLVKQGVRPDTIVIAGDSAGGGLTAATLLALKATGDPLPGAAVLLSPWNDLSCSSETITSRGEADPVLPVKVLRRWASWYCGTTAVTDAGPSPLFGEFANLPPLLIIVGDAEVLLDDSRHYAEKAKAGGADVTLEVWDEMVHVFPIFAPMLPEGQQAIDRIAEWVKQKLPARATA